MTQMILETKNNLQEMMTQASSKVAKTAIAKNLDQEQNMTKEKVCFDKIYEKQTVSKNNSVKFDSKQEKEAQVQTLNDIKSRDFSRNEKADWVGFREILSKATGEANVETSLDLTLAKDISEIINQLKEAIDETVDNTEDLIEKTVVVDELTTQNLSKESVENTESNAEVIDEEVLFEQILTFLDKSSDMKLNDKVQENADVEIKLENLEEKACADSLENSDLTFIDTESIEILNKLTSEDSLKTEEKSTDNTLEDLLSEEVFKELNIESIQAELDGSENNSLMDSQTPQEQGVKAFLNSEIEAFDLKIDKAINTQNTQTTQAKFVDINPSKILDQISKQLEGLQNNAKVNIVLNPESLGKVTVQLIRTGEGLSAQFTVANQEVRDMLMKGVDGLKETLVTQGVGIDNVSVRVNDSQKSEYNADWTEQDGSRGGNKEQGRSNKEEKEKGLFEQMMAQNLIEEDGNV